MYNKIVRYTIFNAFKIKNRYIKIKFSQLNDLLKSMLTTTIDSPQHKRILRSRNIKNNDPLLNNIRRTYKLNDDAMKIKKAR